MPLTARNHLRLSPPWLRLTVSGLSAYALIGGLVSLLGWVIGEPRLMDWQDSGIAMKANTALAAAIGGAALLTLALRPSAFWLVRVMGLFVALIGGLTLLQHIAGWNLGIDTLLFNEAPGARATAAPGRMGPPASISFLFIGTALLLLTSGGRERRLSSALGGVTAGIALLSLVGYLYGAEQMYMLPRLTGIAMQTASMLFALGMGIMASVPERQPMNTLLEPSAAGLLARRALPLVILVPLLLGWLRILIQERELVDTAFGTSLRTVIEVTLLVGLVWWAAAAVRAHEKPLQRRERELSDFFENASIGLHWVGPDGIILRANQTELAMLGYAREEYVGHHIAEFHDDRSVIDNILVCLTRGDTLRERPARLRCKNGSIKDVIISSNGLFEDGKFIHTRCFTLDVTERKRAEAAERASEERYRMLFNTIDEGFCVIEMIFNSLGQAIDFRFLEANAAFEKQSGLRAAMGKTMRELVPDHESRWFESYGKVAITGEPLRFIDEAKAMRRWFDVYAFRIGENNSPKIAVLFTDITERKKSEDALNQAQVELQQHAHELEMRVTERTADLRATNDQLESFVYSIAHDLRAPLRAMTGFSQILVDDYGVGMDESAQKLLQRIHKSSEFMDKLLLDLLAFGRAARTETELSPVSVRKAWEAAIFQTASQAEQTNARIEVIGDLPDVLAHEATLGQCLANLLSNAMKFIAPDVPPHVRFRAEETSLAANTNGGETRVRFWVEDNGIGIAPEHQDRVFRVFERLHGSRYAGTGIGLSIVRKGIERMGGAVGLESELNRGSRVWIELTKAS